VPLVQMSDLIFGLAILSVVGVAEDLVVEGNNQNDSLEHPVPSAFLARAVDVDASVAPS
jgi:hypothetical protein